MLYYKNGNTTRTPIIPNVIAPSEETILKNGWFIYIDNPPSYDSNTQRIERSNVEIVGSEAITPAQVRVALAQLQLLETVEQLISTVPLAFIWWEYALEIRRDNQYVEMIGAELGWDRNQIDQFFIQASVIT